MDSLSPEQIEILASEDQAPKIIGIVSALTVLAFISVVLRFFTRIKFTRQLGAEDYTIACSVVFSILLGFTQIKQAQYGAGKHMLFVDDPTMTRSQEYLYWSTLVNVTSFVLIKVSICLQYRRIFSVTDARVPIYVVMVICIASGISALLTYAFICVPPDAFWNLEKRPTSKCVNQYALTLTQGILNVVTDFMVAALPIRAIWRLQLERRQKIALIAIMTIGWCVCIVSCLRLHSLVVLFRNLNDATWYTAPIICMFLPLLLLSACASASTPIPPSGAYANLAPPDWAAVEVNLAIICACIPTLRPLFIRIIPNLTSRSRTGPTNSQPTASSRWSKLGRSFRKLDGSDNSAANPASAKSKSKSKSAGRDSDGTELGPVSPLLPAAYGTENEEERRIRVTRELVMKSYQTSRGTSILDLSEVESRGRGQQLE